MSPWRFCQPCFVKRVKACWSHQKQVDEDAVDLLASSCSSFSAQRSPQPPRSTQTPASLQANLRLHPLTPRTTLTHTPSGRSHALRFPFLLCCRACLHSRGCKARSRINACCRLSVTNAPSSMPPFPHTQYYYHESQGSSQEPGAGPHSNHCRANPTRGE